MLCRTLCVWGVSPVVCCHVAVGRTDESPLIPPFFFHVLLPLKIDEVSRPSFMEGVYDYVIGYDNVCLLRYDHIIRYTGNVIGTALKAMQWTMENASRYWSHFIMLSGEDYPVISVDEMTKILSSPENRTRSFLPPYASASLSKKKGEVDSFEKHASVYSFACLRKPVLLPRDPWVLNMSTPLYNGHTNRTSESRMGTLVDGRLILDWKKSLGRYSILHRSFIKYLVSDPVVLKMWTFFKDTYMTDYHFLPTVFWNSRDFNTTTKPTQVGYLGEVEAKSKLPRVLTTADYADHIRGHNLFFIGRVNANNVNSTALMSDIDSEVRKNGGSRA